MTRSQMQSTVIQCIILTALSLIIPHELSHNAYDSVWEDPTFKNFTSTLNMADKKTNTTTPSNVTLTQVGHVLLSEMSEPFYTKSFPIDIFVYALLCPLNYYWHIYLDRFFPARPRGVEIDYSRSEKAGLDINEGQEEEVVKRWISQGKVRRSSVSWWNTFVKWALDRTVGRLCWIALEYWLSGFIRWETFSAMSKNFKAFIMISYLTSFLSLGPFTSLIGFIIIPAAKRPVLNAGGNMIESIFLTAFLNLAVPWVIRTDMVQYGLGNYTEDYYKNQARGKPDSKRGRLKIGGHLGDEL